MMQSELAALLKQARSGDDAALKALLLAVQPQLYRFSMKMCRHTQDAEDVLQNSMLTLARSFRDFRGASSLSTWLFSIARSFCIKQRRKSKFAPEREESLEGLAEHERHGLESGTPDPHERAESAEIWREVQTGIQTLEPAYREVLVLRDIEGLTAKEVAEVMDISVSAVKSRLHRARGDLRDALAAHVYPNKKGCPDIRRVFSEHLEGDLSSDICATMEAHVETCPDCRAECEGLTLALNACSTAPAEVPPRVQDDVRRALRSVLSDL